MNLRRSLRYVVKLMRRRESECEGHDPSGFGGSVPCMDCTWRWTEIQRDFVGRLYEDILILGTSVGLGDVSEWRWIVINADGTRDCWLSRKLVALVMMPYRTGIARGLACCRRRLLFDSKGEEGDFGVVFRAAGRARKQCVVFAVRVWRDS